MIHPVYGLLPVQWILFVVSLNLSVTSNNHLWHCYSISGIFVYAIEARTNRLKLAIFVSNMFSVSFHLQNRLFNFCLLVIKDTMYRELLLDAQKDLQWLVNMQYQLDIRNIALLNFTPDPPLIAGNLGLHLTLKKAINIKT